MTKIQQNLPEATVESILDALKEDESIRAMRVQPDSSTDAFLSRSDRGGFQRIRGRSRSMTQHRPNGLWCTFCNTPTHNTVDCRSKQFASASKRRHDNPISPTEDAGPVCWHCGEDGHRISKCPVKKRGDEARARGPKRQKQEVNLGEKEAGGGF